MQKPRCALLLLCLALWLPGFFTLPPGDRDESRFAQATKQMVQTGNYVRILNGTQARNKKPIGIYWLQAPFVLAAGPGLANPIWPYRLPSLLGGIVAVLALFEIGLLATGEPRVAALAAGMLAASVILTTETHIAKTDAALLGVTTIAMAVLARAWAGARISRAQAALFWLAMGAGILIKGPITPMVAGLTTLTLWGWDKRANWLRALRPGWGVALMLAMVLPWFIAIAIDTHGAFFTDAVGGDLGRKLAGGAESHGGFPGLHLLLLPLLAFPSSLAVIAALPAAWANRRDRMTRFCIAWVVPSWLVFEAVPTKLPHYTLPLYPALFLLAARFVLSPGLIIARDTTERWSRLAGRIGLGAAGALLGIGALALPLYLHATWWLGLPAALAAAATTLLAWRGHPARALLMAVPLYAAILQLELPHISALWIAPRVESVLRATWPGTAPDGFNSQGRGLAVSGYDEPSLLFTTGTDTQFVPTGADAATALQTGHAHIALVSTRDLPGFTKAAVRLGLATRALGTITGFNYSRGRWVSLHEMIRQAP